ncbi:MAG: VWA domain-containing protein [Phycisphaerales bacterium JB052]
MTELLPTFSFTGWRFAEPQWLMLLWALPVLAVLMLAVYIRSRRSIRRLGDRDRIDALLGTPRSWNTVLRVVICMLALASIILASARPQSDPREIEVDSKGRDVVFLIDVSRSMLARDVAPNRLEKTKLWIKDLVDELGGDRVGLVAFAGSSRVISPLTNDRLFFKLALEELTPESVQVGGTNIGDAIRRTMELVFPELGEGENGAYRDIVLISDGEDQDSLPVEAARRAGAEGVRIIALGIGSDKGALIQSSDEQGQRSMVRSKLESTTLRQIAAASPGGVYLEVGTGTIDLAQVYQDLIASADQRTLETASTVKYTERFMVFLATGIALIMLDLLAIPTRTRRAPA